MVSAAHLRLEAAVDPVNLETKEFFAGIADPNCSRAWATGAPAVPGVLQDQNGGLSG